MARIDMVSFVANFVQQNKGLPEEQLRVGLRNALQDQKRNGVKISPKEMAQANAMLSQSLVAQNVKAGINAGEKAQNAVRTMAPQQAVETYSSNVPRLTQNQYDMLQYDRGNALKERRNALQQELQEAFGVGKNDVQRETVSSHFVENNRAARRANLLDGMIDKEQQGAANFEEHLEKLSPKEQKAALEESRQITIEPYVSTKKAKKAKKLKIKANQLEHKRYRNTKKLRNARYCTQNGIMTHDAKRVYDAVSQQANGHMHVNVNTTAPIKSAEESAQVFMANGFKPIEKLAGKGGKIAIIATILAAVGSAIALSGKDKQDEVVTNPQQAAQNIQYVA